jgi:hypothetical protein
MTESVEPIDWNEMRKMALTHFGLFNSYVEAGFTEAQALTLVANMLQAMMTKDYQS